MEGSGNAFNTVPPSDYGFFELDERGRSRTSQWAAPNPELLGQLAAIGIVKGEPFEPDARMRRDPRRRGLGRQRDFTSAVLPLPGR